jgi:hypothetical protein
MPRITASPEYDRWQSARVFFGAVGKEAPQEKKPSQIEAQLASQLEILKAQLSILETIEEAARMRLLVFEKP